MPLTAFDIAMSKVWANSLVLLVGVAHSLNFVVIKLLEVPVFNDQGQCVAMVTQAHLFKALREKGNHCLVSDMIDLIPPQIEADAPLLEAWEKLRNSKLPAAAIVDANGRLSSCLTMTNLSEFIITRTALHDFSRHHGTTT